ncbi:MAG TPA: hypothetical protein VFC86_00775 [Planctomycetota bacterium]|nr:hypothetical protein [Planctomycetota bacterium]
MSFDPKALAKSPAFATAGGVVVGLGVFWLISGAVEHLIRPIFNFINDTGSIRLWSNTYLGCGGFLSAAIICVVAVVVGGVMIKMAGKP